MRKIGMLLVILVTGYFAGVYRNEPLMVMVVTEVLLMAVMWLFSILLRQTLSIGFASSSGEASMGDCFSCGVAIRNKGLLPVSRFRLSLSSGYEGGKKKPEIIYGGTLKGEQRLSVDVDCRHCGIARVSADKVKVYDYLSLYSTQKKIGTSMMITVYPKDMAAGISLKGLKEAQQIMQGGSAMTPYSGGNDEIRLLREYREGDSVRHVHWNLTARMDELWVREYDSERDVPLHFFIDLRGLGPANEKDGGVEKDGFFVVLNSLLLGLLEDAGYIKVWWRRSDIHKGYGNETDHDGAAPARAAGQSASDMTHAAEQESDMAHVAGSASDMARAAGQPSAMAHVAGSASDMARAAGQSSAMAHAAQQESDMAHVAGSASYMPHSAEPASSMDIRSRDDCRRLLRHLYLERLGKPEPVPAGIIPDGAGSLLSLDTALCWRLDGQLIWRFSPDGYVEELRSNVFEL
jgi:hypothetical protein